MLNNVTDNIMLSTASPDPFPSITDAQDEPAVICERHRAIVVDLNIQVFYGKCQLSYMVPVGEYKAH